MKWLITLLVVASVMLVGCSTQPPGLERSKQAPQKENTQDLLDAAGPVKGLDPNLYYVSKSDLNRKIYCGADPMLHKVGRMEIRTFQTLEEAKHEFPGYELYRPCSDLMK